MKQLFKNIIIVFSIIILSVVIDSLGIGIIYIFTYVSLKVTCGGFHKSTEDTSFLLTFRVYDGANAVTSSGSLQRNQTRSSLVRYTSLGTLRTMSLNTTLSKYCRCGQRIEGVWYVIADN